MEDTLSSAAPTTSPVRRTKLSDQIYDLIYQRIATGQYSVDSKLPAEAEFAAEFQASRPVIREALAALREDGLIVSRERIGYFVVGVGDEAKLRFLPLGSLADVQRCFIFRISLEGEAAYFAAANRNEDDMAAIASAAANLERLVEENKPSVDADFAFHLAVVAGAHNRFFETTLRSLINHVRTGMGVCRRLSIVQPELHLDQMKEEHRAVVEAVAASDPDAARAAMRYHIDASRQRVFEGQHLL